MLIALLAAAIADLAAPSRAAAAPSMVVDVASGRVIAHAQAFQRWYPASLTKLMTMYVVFRELDAGRLTLDSRVAVSRAAAEAPPAKMYFQPGTQMTLDAAMKMIMVKSANDVAVAIAESVAGSQEAFVARMNAEARRLGMADTRFVNPHGLPGVGQYTTARDMALLGVTLRREFPQFAGYFALEGIRTGSRELRNFNVLIGRFDGADGMKTGFICASGFNQVSTATRNGRTVLAVVMGADDLVSRAASSAALLHSGLAADRLGERTLWTLEPYGDGRRQVVDASERICSAEARQARAEGRDDDGKLTITSPYLGEEPENPTFVAADVLTLAEMTTVALSRVPLPTPNPRRTPATAIKANAFAPVVSGASATERAADPWAAGPTAAMPVPVPRPSP